MPSISISNPSDIDRLILSSTSSNNLGGNIDLSMFVGMNFFECNDNGIESLINLPDSLYVLKLSGNNLKEFPYIPPGGNLDTLIIPNNGLRGTVPELDGLFEVILDDNEFTELPDLSSLVNCGNFTCSNNNISGSFPDISSMASLRDFDCSGNKMTDHTSQTLPQSLNELDVSNNRLSSAAIDKILADATTSNLTQLNLGGGENCAPSIDGVLSLEILESNDVNVTTNSSLYASDFSQDMNSWEGNNVQRKRRNAVTDTVQVDSITYEIATLPSNGWLRLKALTRLQAAFTPSVATATRMPQEGGRVVISAEVYITTIYGETDTSNPNSTELWTPHKWSGGRAVIENHNKSPKQTFYSNQDVVSSGLQTLTWTIDVEAYEPVNNGWRLGPQAVDNTSVIYVKNFTVTEVT